MKKMQGSGTNSSGCSAPKSTRAMVETLEGRALLSGTSQTVLAPTVLTAAASLSTSQPSVGAVRPGNGATNVSRDTAVATDLQLPNGGVNSSTVNSTNVKLIRTSDGAAIPATVNTSGGGDTLVLQPTSLLAANTKYTFQVTSGVKDVTGQPFVPFTSTFTTGSTPTSSPTPTSIAFDRVTLPTTGGRAPTPPPQGAAHPRGP